MAASTASTASTTGPLRHLMGQQQEVRFLYTPEEVQAGYQGSFNVHEAAALLNGNRNVVRTRINFSSATSITQPVADRLGLARQQLGGTGGQDVMTGSGFPVDMLVEPLHVRILVGPNQTGMECTLPMVVVVPGNEERFDGFWEFQLGNDFCRQHLSRSGIITTLKHQVNGQEQEFEVPMIAPRPGGRIVFGSSSFNLAEDTYQHALQLVQAR